MSHCDHCDQEMKQATCCTEGVDLSVIPEQYTDSLRNCKDCGVVPGACHHPGCDVERCGCCGRQAISCGCAYPSEGEKDWWYNDNAGDYPDMDKAWAEARARATENDRVHFEKRTENRWRGIWPGYAECFELGWFARSLTPEGKPLDWDDFLVRWQSEQIYWHIPCEPGAEGASPDLNRWSSAGCPTGADMDAWRGEDGPICERSQRYLAIAIEKGWQ